jgi:dihydrofolate reductase
MAGMVVWAYMGMSVDGFIARRDGGLDFLEVNDGSEGGQGFTFEAFMAGIDALVMGRRTFEVVRGFGKWPYDKPVVVLSRSGVDTSWAPPSVSVMSGEPAAVVAALAGRGWRDLYVDGGETVMAFLRAGLVDRLVITRVPVLVGQGIPLFGSLLRDVRLRHVRTDTMAGGLVQTQYEVVR